MPSRSSLPDPPVPDPWFIGRVQSWTEGKPKVTSSSQDLSEEMKCYKVHICSLLDKNSRIREGFIYSPRGTELPRTGRSTRSTINGNRIRVGPRARHHSAFGHGHPQRLGSGLVRHHDYPSYAGQGCTYRRSRARIPGATAPITSCQ